MNCVYTLNVMRYFADFLGEQLGWPVFHECLIPSDTDTVLVIGGGYEGGRYDIANSHIFPAKRKLWYWHGADVATITRPDCLADVEHIADGPMLQDLLREHDIDAKLAILPTRKPYNVTPLPKKPVVASYLGNNAAAYGEPTLDMLARAMPDVEFLTYEFGHYDDMQEVIDRSRVYLRLRPTPNIPEGGAQSAREFMEAGRRAVITSDLPFATRVQHDDLPRIISAIRCALKPDKPDKEAAAYYAKFNRPERWRKEVGL